MILEKNIPKPKKTTAGRVPIYPLGEMEVGDSFRVSEEKCITVRVAASIHGKKYGKKFTVRKYEDAYRCWRIA